MKTIRLPAPPSVNAALGRVDYCEVDLSECP